MIRRDVAGGGDLVVELFTGGGIELAVAVLIVRNEEAARIAVLFRLRAHRVIEALDELEGRIAGFDRIFRVMDGEFDGDGCQCDDTEDSGKGNNQFFGNDQVLRRHRPLPID